MIPHKHCLLSFLSIHSLVTVNNTSHRPTKEKSLHHSPTREIHRGKASDRQPTDRQLMLPLPLLMHRMVQIKASVNPFLPDLEPNRLETHWTDPLNGPRLLSATANP